MNVVLTVISVLEIAIAITGTEAKPNWSWGVQNRHKQWSTHHSETYHSCRVGECVKAWNCPEAFVAATCEEDSCLYRENGPWVCCLANDNSHQWGDTNSYSSDTPNYYRQTTMKSLKGGITSSPETYGNENSGSRKPLLKDSWNSREESPHIRPLGDILKNDAEKYPIYRTRNKTVGTKVPSISVTKFKTENSNKTNLWEKSRTSTSSPHFSKRTTNLWEKSHISTLSPNYNKRTTNLREKHRSTTTSPNYSKRTMNLWEKSRTSTESPSYNKRTTNLWDKHRTSESRIIFPTESETKYSTSRLPTKRVSTNISTKKSWSQSTSTKASWGYTTANTRRSGSTTNRPYSMKPTVTTKVSTRRNQSWGNPTTGHSTRSQSSKPKTTRPSIIHSTTKTTRRNSVSTPLPNVNIHSCGMRDERTTIRRQTRGNNYRRRPVDAFFSGNIHSRSRLPFQRIVGGEEAEPFSWPWVAALYKVTSSGGNRFLSAGSLINENFILTAAHVFTPDDLRTASYVAMLGTHDAQDAVAQYVVSSVLLHPDYEHRYYYNDIALLKLERKVVFNNYIMPVCLPSPNAPLRSDKDLLGKNVTVMGWGDDSFGGKSSQVLKQATFPIVSRFSCNASYVRVASNRFPKGITADMLCAGDPKGGKDACQGDSGGPLTVIENTRYTQVGIVSFGYKCGDKEFPGVYTKVSPYLNWIAQNTKHVDDSTDYEYY